MYGNGTNREGIAEIWEVVDGHRMAKATAALKVGDHQTADKMLAAAEQAALSAKTMRDNSQPLMSSGARWPK